MEGNLLYYGDNLDVLRRHIPDESVNLVYLDPPFKSNQDYNVLFADHGIKAAAQIKAFEDTWSWDEVAAAAYDDVVTGGGRVADAMVAFRRFLGDNDVLAYLSMMAPRLMELRRVLNPTGSIYLHCDPAASHYLKMLMDAIFGPTNFRNEIVWKRTTAHSSAKRYGPVHDIILFYSRDVAKARWYPQSAPHSQHYLDSKYRYSDERGTYRLSDLTGSGTRNGPSGEPWRGVDVTARGRHWMHQPEELDALDQDGRIYWPPRGGVPAYKRYLTAGVGRSLQDVWTDIEPINSQAQERLGYPTQKPETLLDRIIQSSSAVGDTILDPFCGCGTSIAVAQQLDRRWVGIDITYLAIGLIKSRLTHTYGDAVKYQVIGEPTTVDDAEELARSDPYQFQFWALGLVGARPVEQKKGADRGIDGRLYFNDGTGATKQVILSVKAGQHLGPNFVRDLRGVVDREGAQIGVLISFENPTQPMRSEAAGADFYVSPWGKHPRIQLVTVGELLAGKGIDYPRTKGANVTYKKAQAAKVSAGDQLALAAEGEPGG